MYLLFLSGAIPSFTDAFFETMSGFTTTGASILTAIEPLPRSLLFWRSLTHWLGGMGIVVLTVAILPFLGVGGVQLFRAESPGPTLDKIAPKITQTAKILWFIYLGLDRSGNCTADVRRNGSVRCADTHLRNAGHRWFFAPECQRGCL